MKQLSLFHEPSDYKVAAALGSLLPLMKAAMNEVADNHNLSRDLIADRMNELSRTAGIKLSSGNVKSIKTASLNKWLAPADREHPPSILALLTFCIATKSVEPLLPLLHALGCELMTEEDRKLRDYGEAILNEKEARKRKRQLEAKF
ncbi:MAG: hypothetical protein ACNI27_06985 [Desulfovibrio sp.]